MGRRGGGQMCNGVRFLMMLAAFCLSGCLPDNRPEAAYTRDIRVYRLGPGDQVRLIVFDQPSLSNVYGVDASGRVSIPLVGAVKAEGKTTTELEAAIGGRLRDQELVKEPKVSVEVAAYRPFAILGEVRTPGRFPYSPSMTIESAVALAGGYTLHADKDVIRVTRRAGETSYTEYCPPTASFLPGDILFVQERWF